MCVKAEKVLTKLRNQERKKTQEKAKVIEKEIKILANFIWINSAT